MDGRRLGQIGGGVAALGALFAGGLLISSVAGDLPSSAWRGFTAALLVDLVVIAAGVSAMLRRGLPQHIAMGVVAAAGLLTIPDVVRIGDLIGSADLQARLFAVTGPLLVLGGATAAVGLGREQILDREEGALDVTEWAIVVGAVLLALADLFPLTNIVSVEGLALPRAPGFADPLRIGDMPARIGAGLALVVVTTLGLAAARLRPHRVAVAAGGYLVVLRLATVGSIPLGAIDGATIGPGPGLWLDAIGLALLVLGLGTRWRQGRPDARHPAGRRRSPQG